MVKQTSSSFFIGLDGGFKHLIHPMIYGSYLHNADISNPDVRDPYYSVEDYFFGENTPKQQFK